VVLLRDDEGTKDGECWRGNRKTKDAEVEFVEDLLVMAYFLAEVA